MTSSGGGSQQASMAHGECENGDYLMATSMLTNSIRSEPNNHELYYERSVCYYKLGQFKASLDDANTAIRLGSDNIMTHYQKGLALLRLATNGDLVEEAIRSFKKALNVSSGREETKLSECWKILYGSMNEVYAAKIKLGFPKPKLVGESVPNSIHRQPPQRPETSSDSSLSDNEQQRQNTSSYHQNATNNDRPNNNNNSNNHRQDDSESNVELYIDVDDSLSNPNPNATTSVNNQASNNDISNDYERVIITPNNSIPPTNHPAPSTSTAREDSYSSKYKRLRRDRERARRGTSKQCTIKLSDLDELQKSSSESKESFMRVIAPIDNWLYSGQLSYNNRLENQGPYVFKLDGDLSGRVFYFDQETVLSDVIKEVLVESVSELRKGARICGYWKLQNKCLITGVVTSRTFEAKKALVSVKYDNGDLSALRLEYLRLLPPDYPSVKGGSRPATNSPNRRANGNRLAAAQEEADAGRAHGNGVIITDSNSSMIEDASRHELNMFNRADYKRENQEIDSFNRNEANQVTHVESDIVDNDDDEVEDQNMFIDDNYDQLETAEDDETIIPPTDETIDFITSENTNKLETEIQSDSMDYGKRVSMTKEMIVNQNSQMNHNASLGPDVSGYGIEYRPWLFEGPSKRCKRNGRPYRDVYSAIRRGNEVIKVNDSAELMPKDSSILPFIAKIAGFWSTSRGEMKVRVRWYYRLAETKGEPYELHDGENALFETDHFDENDVQSIYKSTRILSWTEYEKNHLGHVNKNDDNLPKIFYLAGQYDPVNCIKRLRADVKEAL